MVSSVDIRSDHLKIVQDILCTHLPSDVKVWVFGSRATWTTKDSSDLDLAVEGDMPLDFKTINILKDAFEDSSLPYTVDVVDMNRVSGSFRQVIEEHKTLFPVQESNLEVAICDRNQQDRKNEHNDKVGRPSDRKAGLLFGNWREIPFSQAVQINPEVDIRSGQTYPFVDMAALNPHSKFVQATVEREFKGGGSRFHDGDTLMARITPCLENGKTAIYRRSKEIPIAHGSTEFIVIRGRPNMTDNNFAYYLTQWNCIREYAIGQMIGTSGRQRVPTESLDHITIPLPPPSEQRAIAHILGTLDDKIDLNRSMNETLEAMARAIFKDWFVDFGPTRAKIEGRDPYLTSELWDLFPDSLDDEGKPVGWTASLLGERIEILDSKRIPLSSQERKQRQGPYPYHGATGVMDYVDDFLFEGVHVLLGEDGSVVKPNGKPFTQYVWGQFWVNNHAHVLKGNGISNEMLLCFLQQKDVAPYVTGAVQPKLNQKNLKTIPFSASGLNTPAVFEHVVEPFFQLFRRNSEENRTLIQTRDLLLPKLMSGEIHLPEAEIAVEAVA